jgi:RHS repeat-associated protein
VVADYIYLASTPIARVDEWWEGIQTPSAPTGVTVTQGNEELTVSWNANQEPVDGYKVYWGTESRNYTNSVNVGKTTTYTITGLTNGVPYYIAVKAYVDLRETYYYHTDHLGTPIMMTDKNQNVVWNGEFLPFGEPYSITGTVKNNLRFPGQYFDAETGLHYNWHRDYKPEIGRYISEDPIRFASGDVNLYSYVGNNSVNEIDPEGLAVIVHGKYCGPGAKDPTLQSPGIDCLDEACRLHDICYRDNKIRMYPPFPPSSKRKKCDQELCWRIYNCKGNDCKRAAFMTVFNCPYIM